LLADVDIHSSGAITNSALESKGTTFARLSALLHYGYPIPFFLLDKAHFDIRSQTRQKSQKGQLPHQDKVMTKVDLPISEKDKALEGTGQQNQEKEHNRHERSPFWIA